MKRRRLSDKAYVCLNLQHYTATTQFYVSRRFRKKYGGIILNEGDLSFDVQIESMQGYYSMRRTLPPGEWLEFRNYPLSGVTFYGAGTFTLVAWAGTTPVDFVRTSATRTVNIGNFPPSPVLPNPYPVTISGQPVAVSQSGVWTVDIGGQPISVDVANFPVLPNPYPVSQSGAWNVGVNNFPAGFNCLNFPASYPVTGTFWQATQPISGSVSVSNFPATYPATQSGIWSVGVNNFPALLNPYPVSQSGAWTVSASVSNFPAGFNVNNWPASYPVTGTFWQATQPVSGTFWQATQPVSGTFWQATQPISGAVSVSNFPATYDVSDRAARLLGIIYGNLGQLDQILIGGRNLATMDLQAWLGSQAPTVGQKAMAASIPVVVASNQSSLEVLPKAKGKTTLSKSKTQTGLGSSTIYTVTVAKTLFLVAATIGALNSGSVNNANAFFEHDTAGDGVFITVMRYGLYALSTINEEIAPPTSLSLSVPMPFAAGTVFRIRSDNTALEATGWIVGWEE